MKKIIAIVMMFLVLASPVMAQTPQVQVPPSLQTAEIMDWLVRYQIWAQAVTANQAEQTRLLQNAVSELAKYQEASYQNLLKELKAQQTTPPAEGGSGNPFGFLGNSGFWSFVGKYVLPAIGGAFVGMKAGGK